MTNLAKLFQEQMKDPKFGKAYYEAWVDSMVQELLDELREKISRNESKETLLQAIDAIEQQFQRTAA